MIDSPPPPAAASPAASPAAPWPSRWWYIAHLFLGIVGGIVVFCLYRDRNPQAARRHLIISIILTVAPFAVLFGVIGLLVAVDGSSGYGGDW